MNKPSIPSKMPPFKVRWCLNWSYQLSEAEIQSLLGFMNGDTAKKKNTKDYIPKKPRTSKN